ncbi:hypothetical protein F511_12161 [Dorcoceras hygrometricum]|uniref:Secreted protein n=1 Tax=Dorcoceras hygrometricum TaxID=472368 RepID=A0A2Z7B468_9LAMI|nr:hypothetical protein F511_12161 [Dorcoceras hygrometricum]
MFSNNLFNSCSLSCCLFFVTTLRATAVFFHCAAIGCPDVDLEVLANGTSSCDWMRSNSWQNAVVPTYSNDNVLLSPTPNSLDWLNLSADCHHRKILRLILSAKAKRCRSNLFERHRFAITNSKYHLLVVLRLDTSSSTTSLHLLRLFTTADSFSFLLNVMSLLILQLHLLNSNHLLIVMTSSLLLIASSRMYADVITAVSQFLFASIQQLISSTSEHCSLLLNFSSSILLQ